MVGAIGEAFVGIDPAKKQIVNMEHNNRIPDALGKSFLAEVKNVSYISNSQQLKDFAKIAEQKNVPKYLFVRPNTKIAQSVIDAGWEIRYI